MTSGLRCLYLNWQKLPLAVYVLKVAREEAGLCPRDVLVARTRWLADADCLGEALVGRAQRVAARRADQSSRHRDRPMAGAMAAAV